MGSRRTRSDIKKTRDQWTNDYYDDEEEDETQITFDEVDYMKNFLKNA